MFEKETFAPYAKRVYRDISQKYCSRIDDNVIIVRNTAQNPAHYECLSSHLCPSNTSCTISKLPDNKFE
ncbi:MAG: hypothetical protein IKL81_05725 [Clostridia bacterium]|nr:hypothetical protein [Clostridia bacterium]